MKSEQKIGKLLSYLAEGFPAFKPTEATAAVWQDQLGEFTEEQLMAAARYAVGEGKILPCVGDIKRGIIGEVKKKPIYATDVWDRTILNGDGSPKVERWVEERVLPETAITKSDLIEDQWRLLDGS